MMTNDAEAERQRAWVYKVRTMHRNKRVGGYVGSILGACLMLYGKFSPDEAPAWAVPAGFAMVGVSWLVFIYIIYDRYRWVKANPYKPAD